MKLLGVREAAEQLGVHENTLRRWEQAGLIRAVKLPTGVRRFRPEDVSQMRATMFGHAEDSEATSPS
jgi:excisionase family DNA binding protein